MLIDALDDKVHTCDECSDFICYKYIEKHAVMNCHNLFIKSKNLKYCSCVEALANLQK